MASVSKRGQLGLSSTAYVTADLAGIIGTDLDLEAVHVGRLVGDAGIELRVDIACTDAPRVVPPPSWIPFTPTPNSVISVRILWR